MVSIQPKVGEKKMRSNKMAVENQEEQHQENVPAGSEENSVNEQSEQEAEDEVFISIGEDSPPEVDEETEAPEWVKKLRKTNREIQRENRELKEKLNANKPAENKPVELSKKPTLEDCDYDSDVYDEKLTKWFEEKKAYEDAQLKIKAAKEEEAKSWQSTLEKYAKEKTTLKVKDYEDAEELVQETLSVAQQSMILQGADNPAIVVYALGKNPTKAKELSSIKDPVKFAFAVAKLETTLKVTNRKTPPPPESKISGTAKMSGAMDSTLEKLRAKAAQTGDFTEVIKYKKSKANK